VRVTYDNPDSGDASSDRTLRYSSGGRMFVDINTGDAFDQSEVASWATLHGYEFYLPDGNAPATPDTTPAPEAAAPNAPAAATPPPPDYNFDTGQITPAPEPSQTNGSVEPADRGGADTPREPATPIDVPSLVNQPIGTRVRVNGSVGIDDRFMMATIDRDVHGNRVIRMASGREWPLTEERMNTAVGGGNTFEVVHGMNGTDSVSVDEMLNAPLGSVFEYKYPNGQIVRLTVTSDGLELTDGTIWTRSRRGIFSLASTGSFHRDPMPAAPATPDVPDVPEAGLTRATTAEQLINLPEGAHVRVTNRSGDTFDTAAGFNEFGDPTLRTESGGGFHRSESFFSSYMSSGYTFDINDATAAPSDPRFTPGGTFNGTDIREAPVGSHIRGSSGTEWVVTGSGISDISGSTNWPFSTVASHNATFTYMGDHAPVTRSSVGSGVGMTRGSSVDARNLLQVPDDHWVQWGTGGYWRRRGSVLVSRSGGSVRRIRNIDRSTAFTYAGESLNVATPARAPRGVTIDRPSAGSWTPVSAEVINRYDAPKPELSSVGFDETNTTPMQDYLYTAEGEADLKAGIEHALREAGVTRFSVSVSGTSYGFNISYTTPKGTTRLNRSFRSNGTRVENGEAHSDGGYMAETQDHLFAFYRQHGIEEVEVHGLSGSGWNGGHTWIRRGFRPDPNHESQNQQAFAGHLQNLDRVIAEINSGALPHYNEFLEQAKDLRTRMAKLMSDWLRLPESQRNGSLYELQRELSYLGEVRDANGKTRQHPPSIGWRLLGNTSRGATHHGFWYYGIHDLNHYFTNGRSTRA
jgi:hypothetical protein